MSPSFDDSTADKQVKGFASDKVALAKNCGQPYWCQSALTWGGPMQGASCGVGSAEREAGCLRSGHSKIRQVPRGACRSKEKDGPLAEQTETGRPQGPHTWTTRSRYEVETWGSVDMSSALMPKTTSQIPKWVNRQACVGYTEPSTWQPGRSPTGTSAANIPRALTHHTTSPPSSCFPLSLASRACLPAERAMYLLALLHLQPAHEATDRQHRNHVWHSLVMSHTP